MVKMRTKLQAPQANGKPSSLVGNARFENYSRLLDKLTRQVDSSKTSQPMQTLTSVGSSKTLHLASFADLLHALRTRGTTFVIETREIAVGKKNQFDSWTTDGEKLVKLYKEYQAASRPPNYNMMSPEQQQKVDESIALRAGGFTLEQLEQGQRNVEIAKNTYGR